MKRMKIALMALMAVFMGTTFTSCLDSDNGPAAYPLSGLVDTGYLGSGVVITASNGVNFTVTNPEAMEFSFTGSTDTFYPRIASIAYNQVEGEDYTEGKTSYKVYYAGYYDYFFGGYPMKWDGDAESLTPINSLVYGGDAFGHILVAFTYYHKDLSFEDFSLFPYKWENNKLYLKLVHNKEVDTTSNKTSGMYLCFQSPPKASLQDQFPDIVFSGEDQDTVEVMIEADGEKDTKLSLESSFKAKFSN